MVRKFFSEFWRSKALFYISDQCFKQIWKVGKLGKVGKVGKVGREGR
jgi:hypothetical protein